MGTGKGIDIFMLFFDMKLNIHQQESGSKGSFYAEKGGERLAEITYSIAGAERIIIDHTEVDDILRGLGVGLQLVEYAVHS